MELANGANALKCAALSSSSIMLHRANVEAIVTCKMALMGAALFVPGLQRVKAESASTPGVTAGPAVEQHVFYDRHLVRLHFRETAPKPRALP